MIKEGNKKKSRKESLGTKDYFEQYWRYCSALRNWFVIYGIGGCILFITDKAKIFQDIPFIFKSLVILLLFGGVAVQIILAFINKCIHWCVYWGDESESFGKSWLYRMAKRVSSWFWIDVAIDLITFAAFVYATLLVIITLLFCRS